MSEDPPTYSLYAEAAPGQAEVCFNWLAENMTQWTCTIFTSKSLNEDDDEREDVITTGFTNDAQRKRYWKQLHSAETRHDILCIHYQLDRTVIVKRRKELPSCFVNPFICEAPFYPGDGVSNSLDYCSRHKVYSRTPCPVCYSGIGGVLRLLCIIPAILWELTVDQIKESYKSRFPGKK